MTSRVSAYRTLASESRMHILHVLQGQDDPITVDAVAEAVGLHINTAREHLDRLVDGGFVTRQSEVRTTRGRPRMLYRSVDRMAAATMDVRAREHLTRMLVEGYGQAMTSPAVTAQEEGRRWAAELLGPVAPAAAPVPDSDAAGAEPVGPEPTGGGAADPEAAPPGARVETVDGVEPTPAEAAVCAAAEAALAQPWDQLAALERHFEDLGFDPEVDLATLQVHLRRCPLMDLAQQRTEIVCSVHLGLAQGVLARQGGRLVAERLEPFVGPRHCVLHLRRA